MLERLRESSQNSEDLKGLHETRMHVRNYNRYRVEKCMKDSIKSILKYWNTEVFVLKR